MGRFSCSSLGRLGRGESVELRRNLLKGGIHVVDAGERGKLRHLREHLLVIDRIERVLLLHLHRQQAHEVRLAERREAARGVCGGARGARRSGPEDCVDRHFILIVSSISCLAVESASTTLRYCREASSISTISAFSSTGAVHTSPFSSASGWSGSWTRAGATSAR